MTATGGEVRVGVAGDVVAHHASEPAVLVVLVGAVIADVGRGHDAEGEGVGVASRPRGGLTYFATHPSGNCRGPPTAR